MPDLDQDSQIIIAGASVRSLAQSAVAAGLKPICIDLFCDADLRQLISEAKLPAHYVRLISDFDQLESTLSDIDRRIPLIPVGGLEFFGSQLDRIRQQRPVFAIASHVIAQLRNPLIVFPLLQNAGHHVPDFRCAEDTESEPAANWLKKDSLSSGGHSVSRIHQDQWRHEALKLKPSQYLQQEVSGIPCSATFVATQQSATTLLGCALQLCGESAFNATGFQFCGNAGPVRFADSTTSQLLNIAACLQNHWPLQGIFGIDFIWNAGNISVIEINPRLTASHEIHEVETKHCAAHILQHCQAFQPTMAMARLSQKSQPLQPQLNCRFILYSDRTVTVTTEDHERMMKLCRPTKEAHRSFCLSDIPEATCTIQAGAPFCSINFTVSRLDNLPEKWPKIQSQLDANIRILNVKSISAIIPQLHNRMSELQAFTNRD